MVTPGRKDISKRQLVVSTRKPHLPVVSAIAFPVRPILHPVQVIAALGDHGSGGLSLPTRTSTPRRARP